MSCRCHRVGLSWQNSQMAPRFISLVYIPCITPSTQVWEDYEYDKKIFIIRFCPVRKAKGFCKFSEGPCQFIESSKGGYLGHCYCYAVTKSCPTHGLQCTKLFCL